MKTVYEILGEMIEEERDWLRFLSFFGRFVSQDKARARIDALEYARDHMTVEDAGIAI